MMPTPQKNHSLWNKHLACYLEWCNISVVTELRYTVIANTFRAIASIAKAMATHCQISAILGSIESMSNLKSQID